MKIRICIPFYHEICSETIFGVQDCLKQKKITWEIVTNQGPYIGQSRNHLINRGKSRRAAQDPDPDVDYFLFVDADIGFQFRHVAALLEHAADIVSGAYLRQRDGKNLTAGKWVYYNGAPFMGFVDMERCLTANSPKRLTDVDYAGGGFLLVKQSVFKRVPFPWFREMLIRSPSDEIYQIGEDLGFCVLANHNGVSMACDTRVTLFHKPRPRVDPSVFWAKKGG